MKNSRGFVAVCVCFVFLVSLIFIPSTSNAQNDQTAGGTVAGGEGSAGAGAAGAEAGAGAATGLSKGTIAAIVIGAVLVAGGIAAAAGGGGGGGGHGATVTH